MILLGNPHACLLDQGGGRNREPGWRTFERIEQVGVGAVFNRLANARLLSERVDRAQVVSKVLERLFSQQEHEPGHRPIRKAIALTFRLAPGGDFPLGTKTIVGVVGDAIYRTILSRRRLRRRVLYPLSYGRVLAVSR